MNFKVIAAMVAALSAGAINHVHAHFQVIHGGQKVVVESQSGDNVLELIHATPDQANQIRALRAHVHEAMIQFKSQANKLTKPEMEQHMKQAHEQLATAVKGILTPAQMKTLEENGGVMALFGFAAPGNPWELLAKLNLTQDQTVRAKRIVGDAMDAMDAMARAKTENSAQAKAKMEAIHLDAMKKIAEILTPEQVNRLHTLMSGMEGVKHSPPPGV